MGKEFKILSIDGGGMKGIFSARILQQIEQVIIERNPNERLVDYFDMICGTSTGGIIALALSQRILASDIVTFYEQDGPHIFLKPNRLRRILNLVFRGWVYDTAPLRNALHALFGEKVLGDSECLLCIPAYALTKGQPFIMKYDHDAGVALGERRLSRDNKITYVNAALATCAAPAYFAMHTLTEYNDYQLIDGAVYANNPTLIGLTEALHYFVGAGDSKEFDSLAILSVASLNENTAEEPDLPAKQGVLTWTNQLLRATMSGQSLTTDFAVKQICSSSLLKSRYIRVPSATIAPEHSKHIQLDAATPTAIKLMRGKGDDQGLEYCKKPEILSFFDEMKHYRIKERVTKNG